MNDTWELRDLNEECEHGYTEEHVYADEDPSPFVSCPGGKRIVLRKVWVSRSQFNVDWEPERSKARDRAVYVEVTEDE